MQNTISQQPLGQRDSSAAGARQPCSASADESHAKSASVEYLNVVLMLIALVVACVVPFELFLFSYAVIGPLHYLTEISWLHDRRFFALGKRDWLPLVICALLITLGNANVLGEGTSHWLNRFRPVGVGLADTFNAIYPDVTFFAFGAALVFVLTMRPVLRLAGMILIGLGGLLFHAGDSLESPGWYYKLFGVYLPTLIHVFVFTGAFILLGALKRRSFAGYVSLAAFLICGALAIWLPNFAAPPPIAVPAVFWRGFRELSFSGLEDLLGHSQQHLIGMNVFTSELVLRLVRFLAFAYTYHYLNWFSKTSIIKWHAVSTVRLALVAIGWIGSIAIYAMNYDLGLRWLFMLSLSHVLLEFPLNHRSFIEIGTLVRQRFADQA